MTPHTYSIFGREMTPEDSERSYAERHLIWDELDDPEADDDDDLDFSTPAEEF